MSQRRNKYSKGLKAKAVLEVLNGQKTSAEIASLYKVHPNQISKWKKKVLAALPEVFSLKPENADRQKDELTAELYQQIGQLKAELDWLKKNLDLSTKDKRLSIDMNDQKLSISRQCGLLGLNRSSYYYHPKGESEYSLMLMNLIDEIYRKTPFYGSPKMTEELKRKGHRINHKRIERLMRVMGIEAICPGPNLSKKGGPENKIYPYLLKGLDIDHPNHVWVSDITYIRMHKGFIYLVAIMDWFSRYVLSWDISVTLDNEFCKSALERALLTDCPEIFNTDQGSRFTSADFTDILLADDIKISMDGAEVVFSIISS